MNQIQRKILVASAITLLVMFIYQPRVFNANETNLYYYALVFNDDYGGTLATTNYSLLVTQWFGSLLITFLLVLISLNYF